MVILNNISVLQENLLKELGILATMTRVCPIAKIEKLWMDGKNPSLVKVSASLWQAQKQKLTSQCEPK